MKKTIFFLFSICIINSSFGQSDPIIMEVNGDGVTKSEFLQIYLKNNNDPKYDKASIDEYMDLFTKFKLKVEEAEAQGYDTVPKKNLKGIENSSLYPI